MGGSRIMIRIGLIGFHRLSGSEVEGGGVGIRHFKAVFEHEFSQEVHRVFREGV